MTRSALRRAAPWAIGACFALLAVIAGALTVLWATPADPEAARDELRTLAATARAEANLAPLTSNDTLDDLAQSRAEDLARTGMLVHDPTLSQHLPDGWHAWSENIADGVGAGPAQMHQSWTTSLDHAENLTSTTYSDVGVGFAVAPDGTSYGVEVFASLTTPPEAPAITDSSPGAALMAAERPRALVADIAAPVSAPTSAVLTRLAAIAAVVSTAISAVFFVLLSRRRTALR